MENLKIRCSSLSKVLGSGKGPYGLTQTAMSYVENLVKQEIYEYESDISNIRGVRNGHLSENEAIKLYNEVFFTSHSKNEERRENDFITGTCDIDTGAKIIDIKNAWSSETFPATVAIANKKAKKEGYIDQLQGYMWLWDREEAEVAFCLVDTPSELIEYESNLSIHEVSHIDPVLRVTTVMVMADHSVRDKIIEKVIACRKYASDFKEQILNKNK